MLYSPRTLPSLHAVTDSLTPADYPQARPIVDDCLAETGALLLRGLPLATPEAVEAFFDGLGYSQMPYEPFASRRKKVGHTPTSNTGAVLLSRVVLALYSGLHKIL